MFPLKSLNTCKCNTFKFYGTSINASYEEWWNYSLLLYDINTKEIIYDPDGGKAEKS